MSKLAAFLRRGAPAALAALLLLGAVPAAAEEAGAKVYACLLYTSDAADEL